MKSQLKISNLTRFVGMEISGAAQYAIHYFDDILPEELKYGISEINIRAWHRFIQIYCTQPPSATSTHGIIDQFPQLRSYIPVGIPSLLTKGYIALSFRRLGKSRLTDQIQQFYANPVPLLTSNAHVGK